MQADQTVVFTTTESRTGKYSVDVSGLTGEFEVVETPVSSTVNWWLIIVVIAVVVIAAVVIIHLTTRSKKPKAAK